MRKMLFVFTFLFVITSLSAQKMVYLGFELPYYQVPEKQDYANYKSYGMYVFSTGKGNAGINGFYTLEDTKLAEDTINGDFKILLQVTEIKNPKMNIKLDSAIISAESVTAYIKAYDKSGKEFYSKYYNVMSPRGFLLGNYKDKEIKKELSQELIKDALPVFTRDFVKNYVVTEKKLSTGRDVPVITSFQMIFKKTPEAVEVNDSIEVLKGLSPEELLVRVQKQFDFWKKLTELPDTKENKDFITCGNFNLAFFHQLLDNTEESKKYELASKAAKYGINKLQSLRESQSKYLFAYPIPQGPFVHENDMPSTFGMKDAYDSFLYYVIPNAVVELTDGTKFSGTCKISKLDMNQSVGNVANLDAADYEVLVENGSEEETSKLSKVKQITSGDVLYVQIKRNVCKRVINEPSLSLYKDVFPSESEYYYYQKADGKLDSPPLLGVGKWYKKFFADCPALLQKIDSKELQKPTEIVEFYNKECK